MTSNQSENIHNQTGVLSDREILHEIQNSKRLVIEPFNRNNVTNVAVDLSLGSDVVFVSSNKSASYGSVVDVSDKQSIYDSWMPAPVYDSTDEAFVKAGGVMRSCVIRDKGIIVAFGDSVLCHTHEFSGSKNSTNIIAHAKTRSTLARAGLNLLAGAGWYDVGWIGRLGVLMENTRNEKAVFVPFGSRIVQVIFEYTSSKPLKSYEAHSGNYGLKTDDSVDYSFDALMKKWSPNSILPPLLS